MSRGIVVAIPAKNEADAIGACLRSLAAQRNGRPDATVVCLNNCTDGSVAVVRSVALELPFTVHPVEVRLPADRACAGLARRIAMEYAAEMGGPGGVLLTTDADARVGVDWVDNNLAAIERGADAVAGRALIEPEGARSIPAHLHAADAAECAYAALLDEIISLLDPDPADPWPRHDEHAGASIAVTVAAYRRAGGMPPVRLAEDRAFFAALRRIDARIRHAPEVAVVVSARTVGRAPGGMADTMRRRMAAMDHFLDDRLESVARTACRTTLRARLRHAWRKRPPDDTSLASLATDLRMQARELSCLLAVPHLGAAWAVIEARSPVLRREPLPVAMLAAETARATALRHRLAASAAIRLAEDPADSRRVAAEALS